MENLPFVLWLLWFEYINYLNKYLYFKIYWKEKESNKTYDFISLIFYITIACLLYK